MRQSKFLGTHNIELGLHTWEKAPCYSHYYSHYYYSIYTIVTIPYRACTGLVVKKDKIPNQSFVSIEPYPTMSELTTFYYECFQNIRSQINGFQSITLV